MSLLLTPLRIDLVYKLNDKAVYLSSKYCDGKVLTATADGEIVNEKIRHGADQKWVFVALGEGRFILKSTYYNYMICRLDGDGKARAIPFNMTNESCVWNISDEGEIYIPHPTSGENYLWLVKGALHVTTDGFLADKWGVVVDANPRVKASQIEPDNHSRGLASTVVCIILFLIGVIILTR